MAKHRTRAFISKRMPHFSHLVQHNAAINLHLVSESLQRLQGWSGPFSFPTM